MVHSWAPSDRRIKDEEKNKTLKGKAFAISVTEKEEMTKDFARRFECRASARKRSASWEAKEERRGGYSTDIH